MGEHVGITSAAALFGVTPSTLRWWEQQGVLPPPPRVGGRRAYDRTALRRIGMAYLSAVAGGMPLARAAAATAGTSSNADWTALALAEIARVDAEISALQAARRHLQHLVLCTDDDPAADCPFLDGLLVESTPRGHVAAADIVAAARLAARSPSRSRRDGTGRGRDEMRHPAVAPEAAVPRCLQCAAVLPARGTGRRRVYCSTVCRQRAHRRRHRAGAGAP